VCLDAGDDSDGPVGYRWRWRLLHALGPVLVAAFANSPLREGKPTGWVSSRQQVWAHMDPGRTQSPELGGDPRDAWAAYALDAQLMCVRGPDSADWSAPPGLTFRDWVRGDTVPGKPAPGEPAGNGNGKALRRPTAADLEYHLSTLFPPVRPRGHLELRMIDAQPGDGWVVPVAVVSALAGDPDAAAAAAEAVAPLWRTASNGHSNEHGDPWLRAAQCGPADPQISRASRECFAAAGEALAGAGTPRPIRDAVAEFTERYVLNDRCPADDQLSQLEEK
jgi:glutamate--cysteine ligase